MGCITVQQQNRHSSGNARWSLQKAYVLVIGKLTLDLRPRYTSCFSVSSPEVLGLHVSLLELDRFEILLDEQEEGQDNGLVEFYFLPNDQCFTLMAWQVTVTGSRLLPVAAPMFFAGLSQIAHIRLLVLVLEVVVVIIVAVVVVVESSSIIKLSFVIT
ncbi:hypothetical protein Tco_1123545 [Tanacetum coccineum]|uniref:Uncharacterized protein n=1 Tax=Tanacetum coccineum TaxID=301880 RepID=A0ABQ5J5C0_9ASTR